MRAASKRADAVPSRPGFTRGKRLWGDGFVDDSLVELWRVLDWSEVSTDEYVFFYPQLSSGGGTFPEQLLARLQDCVTVRRWRLAKLGSGGEGSPVLGTGSTAHVESLHREWFADDGAVVCLLRKLRLLMTAAGTIEVECVVLSLLDDILEHLRRDDRPPWSEDAEAWFAFGSGINSGYLWPESTVSPARGCTAAWLGYLDRGRAALMPTMVSDYLLDVVVGDAGPLDSTLAAMAARVVEPGNLRRAAETRATGAHPVVSAMWRSVHSAPNSAARLPTSGSEDLTFEHA